MARKYQIFISSTYDDLKKERDYVYEAILGMEHIPVGMEYFGARSRDSLTVIQKFIDECDFQITIVGNRYGSTVPEYALSFTEIEYDYANKSAVPQIGFLRKQNGRYVSEDESPGKQRRLRAFREKVASRQVAFWETPEDLRNEVQRALPKLFDDNDRPGWVRGDQADDWVMRQLAQAKGELLGVKAALDRYRTNVKEQNRKRFERNQLPIPNVTGIWEAVEKSNILELFEYGGAVISFYQTGTHDQWLYGLWSPMKNEIETQVWRRERAATIDGEKRLTVMFGRIFNIREDSFQSEVFASDDKADLEHNFSEYLTWKRLAAT